MLVSILTVIFHMRAACPMLSSILTYIFRIWIACPMLVTVLTYIFSMWAACPILVIILTFIFCMWTACPMHITTTYNHIWLSHISSHTYCTCVHSYSTFSRSMLLTILTFICSMWAACPIHITITFIHNRLFHASYHHLHSYSACGQHVLCSLPSLYIIYILHACYDPYIHIQPVDSLSHAQYCHYILIPHVPVPCPLPSLLTYTAYGQPAPLLIATATFRFHTWAVLYSLLSLNTYPTCAKAIPWMLPSLVVVVLLTLCLNYILQFNKLH